MKSLLRSPVRFILFASALILYALVGSPTPDNPGVIELGIGLLLVLSAGCASFIKTIKQPSRDGLLPLLALFVFGLFGLTIVGAANGQSIPIMMRDIFAFFFIALPLFFLPLINSDEKLFTLFQNILIGMGICFSIRALLPIYGYTEIPVELLYLANSPLVLLAALLLMVRMADNILRGRYGLSLLLSAALLILPLMAMMIDVQRAPMAAIFLTALYLLGFILYRAPRKAVFICLILGVGGLFFAQPLLDISHEILLKTSRVGLNMRAEELKAVLSAISGEWHTALFGLGWGGQFQAPSVGDLTVSYTHSFLSYILLKGGVAGFALVLLVCVSLVMAIIRSARLKPIYAGALFWPFIIPVLLYASHKSFDFGLMLLFIFTFSSHLQALRERERVVR